VTKTKTVEHNKSVKQAVKSVPHQYISRVSEDKSALFCTTNPV